ncbi:MAG: hypothetical protein M9930_21070 [Anaerolineae bacterium]|nr:hypothetical protein [Anaerolineae bacterium]
MKGLFIIRQHPSDGAMRFIKRLGKMDDKKTLVFLLHVQVGDWINLRQMSRALVNNGAQVIEQFKFQAQSQIGHLPRLQHPWMIF